MNETVTLTLEAIYMPNWVPFATSCLRCGQAFPIRPGSRQVALIEINDGRRQTLGYVHDGGCHITEDDRALLEAIEDAEKEQTRRLDAGD